MQNYSIRMVKRFRIDSITIIRIRNKNFLPNETEVPTHAQISIIVVSKLSFRFKNLGN